MNELSLLEILAKGGWIVFAIGACSVIGLSIVVERIIVLQIAKIDTEKFMKKIRALLLQNKNLEAIALCNETSGPIANMVKAGLEGQSRSRMEIKELIETAGKAEVFLLEKNLGILATIAGIAPLLGFLGTVTGMIKAFMVIQALGGNVNASVLAGGIWEALVTTAVGLSIGIVITIFYNWLIGRVERFVFEMGQSASHLVDLLDQSRNL